MRQARKAIAVLSLATFLAAGPAGAGDGSEKTRLPPPTAHGRKQIAYDARYLARRPFDMGKKGKAKALAIAGATGVLYLLRDEIREIVEDNASESRSDLYNSARDIFGKGALAPTLALITYTTSLATKNPREKETSILLLESMAYSTVAARVGSYVIGAERPEEGDSVNLFDTDGRGVSLDAALAASIVEPLRRQYLRVRPGDGGGRRFWKRTASTVLYTGAGLTAMQRMDNGKHWAPDVFLGLMSGINIGKALGDAHDLAAEDRAGTRVSLKAGPVPGGAAFQLTIRPRR